MSTRSYIGIINRDNSVETIYCHFDGYPSWNGKLLLNHWNTEDRVRELLKLGNLSRLGREVGEKHPFDKHDYESGWCRAYGRDHGETDQEATKHTTVADACRYCDEDYSYLFIVAENRWTYRSWTNPFQPLTAEVCEND